MAVGESWQGETEHGLFLGCRQSCRATFLPSAPRFLVDGLFIRMGANNLLISQMNHEIVWKEGNGEEEEEGRGGETISYVKLCEYEGGYRCRLFLVEWLVETGDQQRRDSAGHKFRHQKHLTTE